MAEVLVVARTIPAWDGSGVDLEPEEDLVSHFPDILLSK
jgi:hypothetical protein